jgi:hypothetical protein
VLFCVAIVIALYRAIRVVCLHDVCMILIGVEGADQDEEEPSHHHVAPGLSLPHEPSQYELPTETRKGAHAQNAPPNYLPPKARPSKELARSHGPRRLILQRCSLIASRSLALARPSPWNSTAQPERPPPSSPRRFHRRQRRKRTKI